MANKLESEFEQDLQAALLEGKEKYKFKATRFVQMMAEYGGVGAARHLLESGPIAIQTGLTELWQRGRLDLSVEARVLLPKYRSLFSDDLREIASRRLTAYEFDLKAWIRKAQPNHKTRPVRLRNHQNIKTR